MATKRKTGQGERLKARRLELDFLQRDVGDSIDVTASTIGQWEREDTYPKGDNLLALAEVLQVEPGWLITGESSRPTPNAKASKNKIVHLPVINAMDIGKRFSRKTLVTKGRGFEYTALPVSLSAFATEIVGDSMINPMGFPSMPAGTMLIVDPEVDEETGDFVMVAVAGGGAICKKLTIDGPNVWLESLNPRYPRFDLSKTMNIIGVVIGTSQRLK